MTKRQMMLAMGYKPNFVDDLLGIYWYCIKEAQLWIWKKAENNSN